MKKNFLTIITIFGLLAAAYPVWAYISSSASYRLQSDAISVGGRSQTSTSYLSEDTIGEIATGESTSTSYIMKAGFQQMQEVYLSITPLADVTLSPDIGGVSGGTANGSANWTVLTDSASGYTLSIKASASPSLQSGTNYFADFTSASTTAPQLDWSIDTTASEFGFTAEGTDLVQKFKDDGSDCNVGSNDTPDKCWNNFLTSNQTISQSASANHPSGNATTVKFRAQSGTAHLQPDGVYTSTITVTVVSN